MRGRRGRWLPALCALSASLLPACASAREIVTEGGVRMVLVRGGEFKMGSADGDSDEKPVHRVRISDFCMDRYLVTQQEYERLTGENPSRWKNPTNPVEQVRWSDAARYCNARSREDGLEPCYDLEAWTCDFSTSGYRLPTEAEWEYACRAGTRTAYFFGEAARRLQVYAWYRKNARKRPRPVGRKKPNPWGLCDMYGNLWEWCNDFYEADYYRKSPVDDPRGPEKGELKVLRGGCWNSKPESCRSASRYQENPAYVDACFGYDVYGFRCVRSDPAPSEGPAHERTAPSNP